MKIEYKQLDLKLAHTWTLARTKSLNSFRTVLVELKDSDGVIGLGEAAPPARYNESASSVETFLRKVDSKKLSFDDLPASLEYVRSLSPGNMAAKCGLNVALFDGASKCSGKAIYNYVGLGFQDNRHVTSFTIGIDSAEVIRRKTEAAADYPVLKMKVGVAEDKVNLQALRQAAPTKPVRLDANEGWATKEQALEMIEWLAEDDRIQVVEQPLPADSKIDDWVWLKKRSPLPIFADESYHLASDVAVAEECFHGVNVKLVKTGGIDAAIEALRAARNAGLKTMLGCMIETSVLITAGAHLAELCDYLDLDGNLLITNDSYIGVGAERGVLSFGQAPGQTGLRVGNR